MYRSVVSSSPRARSSSRHSPARRRHALERASDDGRRRPDRRAAHARRPAALRARADRRGRRSQRPDRRREHAERRRRRVPKRATGERGLGRGHDQGRRAKVPSARVVRAVRGVSGVQVFAQKRARRVRDGVLWDARRRGDERDPDPGRAQICVRGTRARELRTVFGAGDEVGERRAVDGGVHAGGGGGGRRGVGGNGGVRSFASLVGE